MGRQVEERIRIGSFIIADPVGTPDFQGDVPFGQSIEMADDFDGERLVFRSDEDPGRVSESPVVEQAGKFTVRCLPVRNAIGLKQGFHLTGQPGIACRRAGYQDDRIVIPGTEAVNQVLDLDGRGGGNLEEERMGLYQRVCLMVERRHQRYAGLVGESQEGCERGRLDGADDQVALLEFGIGQDRVGPLPQVIDIENEVSAFRFLLTDGHQGPAIKVEERGRSRSLDVEWKHERQMERFVGGEPADLPDRRHRRFGFGGYNGFGRFGRRIC